MDNGSANNLYRWTTASEGTPASKMERFLCRPLGRRYVRRQLQRLSGKHLAGSIWLSPQRPNAIGGTLPTVISGQTRTHHDCHGSKGVYEAFRQSEKGVPVVVERRDDN